VRERTLGEILARNSSMLASAGSLCAVIQGSNELEDKDGPQVTIRDLKLGAEFASSPKDRADYLELRADAQFTAPERELVESVRKVLWRHGAGAET
jgi:histidyl-tRNA synthetase